MNTSAKGGHDYRPDLRLAIFGFFNKHLKNDTSRSRTPTSRRSTARTCGCSRRTRICRRIRSTTAVDELFVPKAEVKLPATKEEFAAWKAGLVKKLRQTSFRALPEKVQSCEPVGGMFGGMVLHLTTCDGPNIEAEIVVRGEAAEETLVVLGTDEIAGEAGNFWSKRLPAPRP